MACKSSKQYFSPGDFTFNLMAKVVGPVGILHGARSSERTGGLKYTSGAAWASFVTT